MNASLVTNRSKVGVFVIVMGAVLAWGAGACGQTWTWENPFPHGGTLNAIAALDANTAVAVGNRGAVLRTEDGGATWNAVTGAGGVTDAFMGVAATGAFAGIGKGAGTAEMLKVGDNGRVQVSEDGGATWADTPFQPDTDGKALRSAAQTADGKYWVVGDSGFVFNTYDLASPWEDFSPNLENDLLAIVAVSGDAAVVVGEGGIHLYTGDCGETWTQLSPSKQAAGTANLNGLDFADALLGVAVGDQGTIERTVDGGATWTPLPSPTTQALRSVAHLGSGRWVAIGQLGTALLSTDDGASWASMPSGTTATLNAVDGVGSTAFAVGPNGMLIRTTNGGTSWQVLFSGGTSATNNGVDHADDMTGIVVGTGGRIMQTLDGGATWTQKTSGTTQQLTEVAFEAGPGASLVPTEAWAVGGAGTILRTTNSGDTWQSQSSGVTQQINGVCSPAPDVAFAVASTGIILHTTDGGAVWSTQTSGVAVTLRDVDAVDAQTAWAVGLSGTILRTTDAGQIWSPQSSGTTTQLEGVDFTDALRGIVVGLSGRVLRTTDGGANWNDVSPTGTDTYTEVAFRDQSTGVIVGSGAFGALITQDGGQTWTPEIASSGTLSGVAITPSGKARAVGSLGHIVTRTLPSVTAIDDASAVMSAGVRLGQSVPNPATHATRISFDLARPAHVTLELFNASGQRVATLVRGSRAMGRHEEGVDLSAFAGGVYFYKLTADGATQGRRLVVVR